MFSGPPADPAAPTGPGLPAAVPDPTGDVPCAGEIPGIPGGASGPRAGRSWTAPLLLCAAAVLALLVALLGPGLVARGTGELRIPGAGLTTVLRTVLFAALALHLGELIAPQLVRPVRGRPRTAVRSWAVYASLAGAAAAAGQIVRLAAVSDLGITETYGTREGGLLLLIANGLVLAAFCAASRRPALALAPLALVIGAEALRAHPEAYSPEFGAALTVVHLTAASLWTGGLLYVLRTMWRWRDSPVAARALLGRYARLAIWLYVALAATGTASTLRRLPLDVVFTSAYGRTLLVKLALMAVVSVLAVAARRRMLRDADPSVAHRLARREQVVLGLVVVVSAILTVVPDPHWISLRP
ncbi:CopD family protein [Streptomyces anulatus]|uniref:CopD family protein n=1 Tax=Streptomyces anulatus TaxID=1892 RepID=UPI00225ADA69|nr:CopD family protein [Streptomyces anulatus]MCX4521375.1 CopD family protein [Streptomyces anulatus]MCX4604251.1 CopD family protein [Streptomyces anulatus]